MRTEGHLRAVFGERGFRRLLATRLTSQFGDGFFQAGLGGTLLFNPNNQTEAVLVAAGFALLLLPYSALGPYVGVFLDRWSRRDIMVWANLLRAVIVVPTALLIGFGGSLWLFVTGALLVIAINRFVLAGLSASQPHVVSRDNLVTANSIGPTLGTAAYTSGLALSAGLQLLLGDDDGAYGIIASIAVPMYIAASQVARLSFAPAELGPDAEERRTGRVAAEIAAITRGMVGGFRHLWERRGAAYVVMVQGVYRMLYGVLAIAVLQLFRFHFDPGPDNERAIAWLGAVVVAGSIGGLLGALVTPYITRHLGPRPWVVLILLGVGLDIAVFGPLWVQPLLVVATFFLNIGSQSLKIVLDTAIQTACDDEFRGRIFSLNDTVFNAFFVLGLFGGALMLPANGKSLTVIAVIAAGYLVVCGVYALASRARTPYDRPSWTKTS